MKKITYLVIWLCCSYYSSFAQVGIGTTLPDPSSILHVESADKGILVPRLTIVQENALVNPATGLLIYNIDYKEFRFNKGTPVSPIWIRTSRNGSVKYSNDVSDTSVNVNANSVTNLLVVSTLEWNDDTSLYIVNTAMNTIAVNEAGRYRIHINVSLATSSGVDRLAPEMWIEINGTRKGTYASTGYIRTHQGHQESSLSLTEVFELLSTDVVSVAIRRTGNSGTVNLRSAGSSNIYIEKI